MVVSILLHLRANKHVHAVPAHSRTKQVLSLQQFHATSSLELTPGLSFEQQEELLRVEQERKDEVRIQAPSSPLYMCVRH